MAIFDEARAALAVEESLALVDLSPALDLCSITASYPLAERWPEHEDG